MLNPNCSEMVMKLEGVGTVKEAIDMLRAEGFIVEKIDRYLSDDGRIEIMDKDNPNLPDFANSASLSIYEGDYDDGEGIYISGHQHCQHQLYKTIDALEAAVGGEFHGYDGGYNFEKLYGGWISKGKPEVYTKNEELREKVRKILSDEKKQKDIMRIFAQNKNWKKRRIVLYDYMKEIIYGDRWHYFELEDKESKERNDKTQFTNALNWTAEDIMKAIAVCMENENIRKLIMGEKDESIKQPCE